MWGTVLSTRLYERDGTLYPEVCGVLQTHTGISFNPEAIGIADPRYKLTGARNPNRLYHQLGNAVCPPVVARPALTPRHVIILVRKCTCLWHRRRWHKQVVTLVRFLITGQQSVFPTITATSKCSYTEINTQQTTKISYGTAVRTLLFASWPVQLAHLNTTGPSRVILSLQEEHLRAACGPRQEERGLQCAPNQFGSQP